MIVNLTPHALNIFLPTQAVSEGQILRVAAGAEAILSLPSVGVVRVEEITEELPSVLHEGVRLPVFRKVFALAIEGLPESQSDTIYVVSFLAARVVPTRSDVFFPGKALRDDDGNVVGCVGLCHV